MLFFARYRLWRGSAQALEMWEALESSGSVKALERLWRLCGKALQALERLWQGSRKALFSVEALEAL